MGIIKNDSPPMELIANYTTKKIFYQRAGRGKAVGDGNGWKAVMEFA
jgi:hypothetical protein